MSCRVESRHREHVLEYRYAAFGPSHVSRVFIIHFFFFHFPFLIFLVSVLRHLANHNLPLPHTNGMCARAAQIPGNHLCSTHKTHLCQTLANGMHHFQLNCQVSLALLLFIGMPRRTYIRLGHSIETRMTTMTVGARVRCFHYNPACRRILRLSSPSHFFQVFPTTFVCSANAEFFTAIMGNLSG